MRILPKHQNLNEVNMLKGINGIINVGDEIISLDVSQVEQDMWNPYEPSELIFRGCIRHRYQKNETYTPKEYIPKRILQSGDRVIVFWGDGSKTIVKRSTETPNNIYSAFTAALAIKVYGNNSQVNRIIDRKHEAVQKVNGKQVVVENYEARKAYRKWLKKREKEISENEKTPD